MEDRAPSRDGVGRDARPTSATVCDSAGQCVDIVNAVDVILGGDDNGTAVQGISQVTSSTGVFALTATSTYVGSVRSCGTGTIVYTLVGTADFNKSTIMHFTADWCRARERATSPG